MAGKAWLQPSVQVKTAKTNCRPKRLFADTFRNLKKMYLAVITGIYSERTGSWVFVQSLFSGIYYKHKNNCIMYLLLGCFWGFCTFKKRLSTSFVIVINPFFWHVESGIEGGWSMSERTDERWHFTWQSQYTPKGHHRTFWTGTRTNAAKWIEGCPRKWLEPSQEYTV